MKFVVVAVTVAGLAQASLNATAVAGGSNCDYVSDNVQYVDVGQITPNFPLDIGKAPLPKNIQGLFWLVDDGGDALISFGGNGYGECSNGKLTEENGDWWNPAKKYCATVSTVRQGGWSFQAQGTPSYFGKFPTSADTFYKACGIKWKFCFNSATNPTIADSKPVPTRPCANLFAVSKTTTEYKGISHIHGGQYWRTTTTLAGLQIPGPGSFDMVQVMDGQGNKIQPAWDSFASQNKQVVYYTGVAGENVLV